MKLVFYGGVKQVTGANYLLESGADRQGGPSTRFARSGRPIRILVDCGMKQGGNYAERMNWEPFSYDPATINAVFITHSHVDHIGLLPKLYKGGFRGKIFSTPPCRDFSELLLYDSQHVLEDEARRFRLPALYSDEDIKGLMKLWEGVNYHQPIEVGPFKMELYNAGHILGSSCVLIGNGKRKILFSGDLGNSPAPIIGDKEVMPECDYCLIESTYGDRIHEGLDKRKDIIEDMIEDTVKAKGVLMIPAFAMERSQELLYEINDLISHGRIPHVPVFIDSPLAIKLSDVYQRYAEYFSEEAVFGIKSSEKLLDFPMLKRTLTTEESRGIADVSPPKVILAGAGMMNAGRILYHLKDYLPDPKSTLLIVGYQAEGSLGRRVLEGAKEVKIHGEKVPVKCRIKAIGGYSAHADQPQLLNWLKPGRQKLKKVFVVQGEEQSSQVLAQKIRDELAIKAEIPEMGKTYNL